MWAGRAGRDGVQQFAGAVGEAAAAAAARHEDNKCAVVDCALAAALIAQLHPPAAATRLREPLLLGGLLSMEAPRTRIVLKSAAYRHAARVHMRTCPRTVKPVVERRQSSWSRGSLRGCTRQYWKVLLANEQPWGSMPAAVRFQIETSG